MKIILYVLEANLYLVILYAVYRILLHRQTFPTWNRWYLLSSLLLAFLLPLIKINSGHVTEASSAMINADLRSEFDNKFPDNHIQLTAAGNSNNRESTSQAFRPGKDDQSGDFLNFFVWTDILLWLYALIITLKLINFSRHLFSIFATITHTETETRDSIIYVPLKNSTGIFSFFNYLFYPESTPLEPAVIAHETFHIRARHTIDLLLTDLVMIMSWFNPILILFRRDLRLNHEYQADEYAKRHCQKVYDYAMLLIAQASKNKLHRFSNQFSKQVQLKDRISRLGEDRSDNKNRLRYLCILPLSVISLMLSGFAFQSNPALMRVSLRTAQSTLPPRKQAGNKSTSGDSVKVMQSSQADDNLASESNNAGSYPEQEESKDSDMNAVEKIDSGNTFFEPNKQSESGQLSEQNIKTSKQFTSVDTIPKNLKWWAPQGISDSVDFYEKQISVLRNKMRTEQNIFIKQFEDRYSAEQTSRADGLYSEASDQTMSADLNSYVTLNSKNQKQDYARLQTLVDATNRLRASVTDEFPMHVSKQLLRPFNVVLNGGLRIELFEMQYKSEFVNSEAERLAFFTGE